MSIKEYIDPFTGQPVKEGKSNKPLQGHAREIRAIGRRFDEPIGSARGMPQGGLCKPPARPVVMIFDRGGWKEGARERANDVLFC